MRFAYFFTFFFFLCNVSITRAQTQVDIQSDLQSGCAPLKVTFTNASVFEAGVSYIWNFGTGAPPVQSQEASRQIVYDNPGVYIVSLTASGSLGKITDTVT
ncbi:MAG TPA: PKD domain-containing protein, partial [Bacteroidales bacterium]|nr:PKD domain-containing protein [Bacteroidales bacterium]